VLAVIDPVNDGIQRQRTPSAGHNRFWGDGRREPEGGRVTQPERLLAIAPGTPMWKAVPPRLVDPYLNGQRTVLAGYVYSAPGVRFHNPAEAYLALNLGWQGSEFAADMAELYLICWLARAVDGYLPSHGPGGAEFYIAPIPIPVGAGMCRLGADGDRLVARYDGLAWQRTEP
jgi:hypothetical protein